MVKVTPKQVHMQFMEDWFPIFENTTFGRIAKGENVDMVKWLKGRVLMNPNKVFKAWKTGVMVGNKEKSHVKVV